MAETILNFGAAVGFDNVTALTLINPGMVRYHLDHAALPEDAYDFIPENRT